MSRLTRLKDAKGTTTLFDRNYSYDPANQISQIAEISQTRIFSYDNLDRLTQMTNGTSNENYVFDSVGNRTASHRSATHSYQPYNQMTATSNATMCYDSNGNMISKTQGATSWTYTWDSENRMKSATSGATSVSFAYDALGRRVKRTQGTQITKFTYDGLDVVMDDVNGTLTKYQNGPGIDNKLKMATGNTPSYFLTDHLGSTNALTNSTGIVTSSASYDSFGNQTGNLATRYSYTGREFDSFTGLHFYRARWYDAKIGRFISEDPIGFSGGDINLYGYVKNNPIRFTDPSGLRLCHWVAGVAGGVAGGAVGYFGGTIAGGYIGGALGGLAGGTGGTFALPGGGTIGGGVLGGVGGVAIGAAAGGGIGLLGGAAGGAYLGMMLCDKEETTTCDDKPKEDRRSCPPCRLIDGTAIPIGAISYRYDQLTSDRIQHGITGSHLNLYSCNQNPNNCRCFWQPMGAVSPPPQPGWIPIQPFAN